MPSNPRAEIDNPCLKEQNITYKCLNDNNYVRDKCELAMQNYKNCKEFWVKVHTIMEDLFQNKVKFERRMNGIRPIIPSVEEREMIKQEFFKTKPN